MSERWIAAETDREAEALAAAYIDLAHPRLGSAVISASNEFFAPKERLIDPGPPIFIPDRYDDRGKWMDGWETRRKRVPGHDWCTLRLGCPGRIVAVDIDTSHFTGNFPLQASVAAWLGETDPPQDPGSWSVIIAPHDLKGDAHHLHWIDDRRVWSHLRLHIYPDGGIARLRVFGSIDKDWSQQDRRQPVDLAALVNGGSAVAWNNAHFGLPANMLAPGKAANMGDGWETARRRTPGNDWAVIRLGHAGRLSRVVVDTTFFKGNFPDRCSLQGIYLNDNDQGYGDTDFANSSEGWPLILPEQKLRADCEQAYTTAIVPHPPINHVRLNIIPDGGVGRLRLFGALAEGRE